MIAECFKCNAYVESDEVGSFERLRGNGKSSLLVSLLKCRRCESAILVERENIGNISQGDIWDKPIVVYPSSGYRANPELPIQLQRSLNEAYACYRANQFTASTIMCRKTLEGICTIKSINARNLVASITRLMEEGIINEQLNEWADVLRNAGNEAAHDIDTNVSKEDAKDLLDFSNAMAEYIFMFKEKYESYISRRLPDNP